jgi:dihydrolipoamide dehydrogenase
MYLSKIQRLQAQPLFYQTAARSFSAGAKEYDLAVIGGGPGGYVAAIKAGQKGLKTVCIEGRGSMGGTCLNVGCIPSKALLNSSHKYEDATKHFAEYGIIAKEVSYDFGAIMKQKEGAVKSLCGGIEMLLKKNKVDYMKGWGKFASNNEVTVDLNDGKSETVKFKNCIIATGSEPSPLPGNVIPIDENRVISSTGALSLKEVPKKMVVVGGGVIGLELGSVYARLGAEVTVVEFMDKICPTLDSEITKTFQKLLTKQGFKFMMSTKVIGGSVKADGVSVEIEDAAGGNKRNIEADYVLVSTGRRPFTEGLSLDKAGLATNQRG